jgi:uncharacterized RDD family membrane protein YckC
MKPTAVVGRRVVAFVIDNIVTTALYAAVFFPLADTQQDIIRKLQSGDISPDATTYVNVTLGDNQYSIIGGKAALCFLLMFVVWVGYWVILQGVRGATLGKAITGIRLVRNDGTMPAGVGRSLVRQLLWIVDSFPYFIPYLTGFVCALANSQNKRVGDMVAGTLVVRKEFAGQAAPVAAETGRSEHLQLGGLSTESPLGGGLPSEPVAAPAVVPAGAPAAAASPPPDWYPDPKGESRLRYWDGSGWTDHTAD